MNGHTHQVYVELVEERPLSRDEWAASDLIVEHFGTDAEFADVITAAHRKYLDNFQPFRILITASNGEPLFRSTERYRDERDARHAIELAFGAGSTVVLQQAGMDDVTLRVAAG